MMNNKTRGFCFIFSVYCFILLTVADDDLCAVKIDSNSYDLYDISSQVEWQDGTTKYRISPCKVLDPFSSSCLTSDNCIGFQIDGSGKCWCLGQSPIVSWIAVTDTFTGIRGTWSRAQRVGSSPVAYNTYVVEVECSQTETAPSSVRESPQLTYIAHWSSATGCVGSKRGGGGGGSSAIGTVGVIDLVIVLSFLVFLGGGSVYNWKVKKQTGLEVIPFRAVWMDVPFLVKDGVLFVFGMTRGLFGRITGRTQAI
eukprot:c36736_g1_i1.p1 GENE.c36736_g1_i1~~c36736_g1_i1.p1  ORF type:complete len:254 (+),score=64.10 c36736_g1_i1:38-799(+)